MREWEKVRPEQARVPESAVADFVDRLEADGLAMHGFAMLDRGEMLAEDYWAPFDKSSLHRMYSVGKSFVALAIGLLQEEGKLKADDRICDYFRDKCPEEGAHPWTEQTTIRHMLTMTTCHRTTTYKRYSGDWVESFFRVEPTNLPGAVFSYDTSATHVLAALVERLSGKKLMDYLREKAFDKIGVSEEAYYMEDPYGSPMGGSGLNCTLRDVLAVAELVMDGGSYRGEQLLPADYLKEAVSCRISTQQQTVRDERLGYGYQIWQGRHGSFYFYGIGGQLAVCFPKERFILVTMGDTLGNKNGVKDIFDAFEESIYPWLCKDSLCDDSPCENGKREGESLASRLSNLALAGVQGKKFSDVSDRVSGKVYTFSENALQISRLSVDFSREKSTLHMVKEGRSLDIAFQNTGYLRGVFPREFMGKEEFAGRGEAMAECLCQGVWVMEDYLLICCYILGRDMANLTVGLRFQNGQVTVKLQKGADDALKTFEGVASSVGLSAD